MKNTNKSGTYKARTVELENQDVEEDVEVQEGDLVEEEEDCEEEEEDEEEADDRQFVKKRRRRR